MPGSKTGDYFSIMIFLTLMMGGDPKMEERLATGKNKTMNVLKYNL